MMRVLVTGSRNWQEHETVFGALDYIAAEAVVAGHTEIVLVHGACPTGADAHADFWGRHSTMHGIPIHVERHPADWEQYGKAAGPIRNADMVALGADVVLAFIQPDSRGTRNCVELAEKAGLKVAKFQSTV